MEFRSKKSLQYIYKSLQYIYIYIYNDLNSCTNTKGNIIYRKYESNFKFSSHRIRRMHNNWRTIIYVINKCTIYCMNILIIINGNI
jgi:hypothetical protein